MSIMPLQAARLSEIWQLTLTWQPDLPRFTTRCCKALKHFVLLPRFVSHLKEKLCLKTTSTYRMTFRIWEPNFTDIQPIPISYTSSFNFSICCFSLSHYCWLRASQWLVQPPPASLLLQITLSSSVVSGNQNYKTEEKHSSKPCLFTNV